MDLPSPSKETSFRPNGWAEGARRRAAAAPSRSLHLKASPARPAVMRGVGRWRRAAAPVSACFFPVAPRARVRRSPPPLNASQGLPLGASMTLRSWPPRPICRIECSVDESPCSLAASPVPTAAWAARSRFCLRARARMWSSASRRIVAELQPRRRGGGSLLIDGRARAAGAPL